MSKITETISLTKGELVLLIKADWTKSLLVYLTGLPIISLIMTFFIGHSSAFLGIIIIGSGLMNIFYAPRQFSFNKETLRDVSAATFTTARLLTLWLFNMLFLLLLPVMIILKFEKDEILVFLCFFIYCFGFVSPLDNLISSIPLKYGALWSKNKDYAITIFTGLLPLLPFPFVLLSGTHQILIMKMFALSGLITLIIIPLILRVAIRNIENSIKFSG